MAPSRPLAISCPGGSAGAQLAARVVGELERQGLVEEATGLEEVVEEARRGRRVVAVDGCASACCARLFQGRGVRPQTLVRLDESGLLPVTSDAAGVHRLAAAAATRIRSHAEAQPRPRRRPRAVRAAAPRASQPHGVADYLLAIDGLTSEVVECGALLPDAPTLAAHVARALGVSRASAGEMLARLAADGLVERNDRKEFLLSAEGRRAADNVVRRQRLLERFAVDFLGYPPRESFERARALENAFDEDAVARLRDALGDPERCPHGWPVEPAREREERRELTALSALEPGDETTVVRVAERDQRLLRHLYAVGVEPDAELVVGGDASPGSVSVNCGGRSSSLDRSAAAEVLVRPRAR